MNEDRAQLRARFSVPADRDLPPGRHLLHRENLMSQILNEPPGGRRAHDDEAPRGRRPRARRLLAVAAAVSLVTAGGVTGGLRLSAHSAGTAMPTTQQQVNATPPGAAPATVTAMLDRIAQAAAAGPAVKVGPDQYFYVKAKVASTSIFAKTRTVEGWVAQSPAKETLWRDNGHSETLKEGTAFPGYGGPLIGATILVLGETESEDKLLYPTYAYLQSLPTNPAQVLKLLEQQVPLHKSQSRQFVDFRAFLLIGQLVSTAVLPPQTAAALYRAAALIPGVTLVPEATDALGRHGIGIALAEGGSLKEEWIFSTATYQFLGARTSTTAPSVTNREVTQTSASAVLARGIANSPGGTPTLIK